MQNRSEFEKEWEKAFADAEMEVSQGLWEKVELDVINASNRKYKKRLFLFQLLAAASVAFALSIGGVGIYHLYYNNGKLNDARPLSDKGAINTTPKRQPADSGERLAEAEGFTNIPDDTNVKRETEIENNKLSPSGTQGEAKKKVELSKRRLSAFSETTGDKRVAHNKGSFKGNKISRAGDADASAEQPIKVASIFEFLEIPPVAEIEMRMVPRYSYVPARKDENNHLWAGIGFSAGTFDPNAASGTGGTAMRTLAFDANSKRTPSFSREKAGQAINMGINIGTRLSERWVLQSGIVYIQQQTTSTSNVVSTTNGKSARALSNYNEISSAETLAFTAPYDVKNTYELIAVPLQAGYVILDERLSIILLSGISNNILLQNQIGSASGNFEDVEISSGSDSRYRTYQISGMFGSEFSYRLGDNYRLSVVPQIRQSINSITKPEVDYSSRPTTLEIGFRLKYIFGK